jgi:hypothetical protein
MISDFSNTIFFSPDDPGISSPAAGNVEDQVHIKNYFLKEISTVLRGGHGYLRERLE